MKINYTLSVSEATEMLEDLLNERGVSPPDFNDYLDYLMEKNNG